MSSIRAGRLALALTLLAGSALAEPAASPRLPNVVLVTLDTTRADHLGCYGYGRATSPHLDALARDSVVFERAWSTSSWTLPAHASLFTGKYPSSHGARYDPEGPLVLSSALDSERVSDHYRASGLRPDEQTLARILRARGYETAAVVAGPWMKRVFGLDAGFEHYDDSGIESVQGRSAESVSDAALAWLGQRGDAPFLLFLNYYDAHSPYADPEGLAASYLPAGTVLFPRPRTPSREFTDAIYDGEIAYMDRHLGRLLDGLREMDLYEDALVIATADHGELLGEHGRMGHGESLYEVEIRVPLLVKLPGRAGPSGRSQAAVQLTDILPLILDSVGLPIPEDVQGVALAAGGEPTETTPLRRVFAEVDPLPPPPSADPLASANELREAHVGSWRALVLGRYKLLARAGARPRLFDLAADPGEESDLAEREPEKLDAMVSESRRFEAALPRREGAGEKTQDVRVDEQTRRALESLGYLP